MRGYQRAFMTLAFSMLCVVRAMHAQTVTYDHLAECPAVAASQPAPDGCVKSVTLRVLPGDELRVDVINTVSGKFKYEIKGYAVEKVTKRAPTPPAAAATPKDTVTLRITHASKYAGYVITIFPADDDIAGLEVGSAIVIVNVPSRTSPYKFGGGISLSNIHSPAYVVETDISTPSGSTVPDTVQRIAIDEDREDAASVGLATFLSVSLGRALGEKLDPFALVIGIGIETSGSTNYYFGAGAELYDGIYINVGYTLGRVSTLPSGLQVGSEVSDVNALQNLGTRSKGGIFLGMSFSFLGGGQEAFGKPFAGAKQ